MPARTFPLTFHDGHPIVRIDGLDLFIDTGCPRSFGAVAEVPLPGRRLPLLGPRALGAFNLDAVRTLAGPVDGLLGMDALAPYRVTFDAAAGALVLDPGEGPGPGAAVPLFPVPPGAPPILAGSHRGRPTRVLFDTGAWMPYHLGPAPADLRPVGRVVDFSPQLGPIPTDLWQDRVTLGGRTLDLRFGRLPAQGEAQPRALGAHWIVGQELLRSGRLVLDVRRGVVELGD